MVENAKNKKLKCDVLCDFQSNNHTQWKTPFYMACKEGQFDVVELMGNDQINVFSINLNVQHVNGMTPVSI